MAHPTVRRLICLTSLGFLVVLGLFVFKKRAIAPSAHSTALQEVTSLRSALELYVEDEEGYPGLETQPDPGRNDFPLLFNALFGERGPGKPGGRSAPYTRLSERRLAVWDQGTKEYRRASPDEIRDFNVPKFLLDPWDRPYVYRAWKAEGGPKAMVYSVGANGIDDTAAGKGGGDDLNP